MKKRFQSCFEKREQMLLGARDSVAESGMEGVSTREIAAKAKLNGAYIYYLFDSKEDLLEKAYLQDLSALITAFQTAVRGLNESNVPLSKEERQWIMFLAVWQFLLEEPNRCRFLYYYYHSAEFRQQTETYQKKMLRRAFQETALGDSEDLAASFERESLYFSVLNYAAKALDGVIPDGEGAAHQVFHIIQATQLCEADWNKRQHNRNKQPENEVLSFQELPVGGASF